MDECWSILIKKEDGEKLRQWLIKKSLLRYDRKIQSENEYLIFPINRDLNKFEMRNLIEIFKDIQVKKRKIPLKEVKQPVNLITAIKSLIPKDLWDLIPRSFDIIGGIVIIEIPEELESYKEAIGRKILEIYPSIKSVYKKIEPIKGEYRLRNIEFLAGIDNTETIHKENKCIFEMDIKKVYFSPRLATEHKRVCSLVEKDEIILDMFAGVGPFSILIAKQKQAQVYAVDVNPNAIYYLKRNVILNKVENYVKIFEGDVRKVIKNNFHWKFDRIIMNLPSKAYEFLDVASKVVKSNGVIHYYQFVPESEYPTKFLEDLRNYFEKYGRKIGKILSKRKVRAYAPYIWQIGIDILIQ